MKVRLVAYREKLTDSGVVVNNPGSTYAVTSSETTITVDGNNATEYFVANQTLANTSGEIYGVVKTVPNATSITLQSVQTDIPDDAILYYYPETQFELDLSEEPSIVVNFNFLELGEPMKRMGSFSQTIKLPFTEDNNKFFQNYFDVNIETMQFDANVKVSSIVYVDSIEQLKGFLQLKAIYLNARQYEVVIFGNSSNFFTAIKDKKMRQAFEFDEQGVITADEQLDHLLTAENVVNSWNSGLTTIDPVTTDNDVMYPIIDYGTSYKPFADGIFVDNTTSGFINLINNYYPDEQKQFNLITPSILKPAIRIQRLFYIICQKAGYTVTSSFLGISQDGTLDNSTYFGKLFMTLGNQYERVKTHYSGLGFQVAMASAVNNVIVYGDQNESASGSDDNYVWAMSSIQQLGLTNESSPNFDPNNVFDDNPTNIYSPDGDDVYSVQMNTITFPSEYQAGQIGLVEGYLDDIIDMYASFSISFPQRGTGGYVQWLDSSSANWEDFGVDPLKISLDYKVIPAGETDSMGWTTGLATYVNMAERGGADFTPSDGTTAGSTLYNLDFEDGGLQNIPLEGNFSLNGVTTSGGQVHFRLHFSAGVIGGGETITYTDSIMVNINAGGLLRTQNSGNAGYSNGTYGMQVVMAENMPDLYQSDFVRDLINRFNLIILNDPDNANNLLIEPYQDFISAGSTQYWTDKLDLSKEQVVKPTSELQKQEFIFQDKESKDVLNARYKDSYNYVYGHKIEDGGDFSSGQGKNFTIYAPFIATGIQQQGNGGLPWSFYGESNQNIAIAQIYEKTGDGLRDRNPITDGVPRLFYYGGTPVGIFGNDGCTGEPRHFRIHAPSGSIYPSVSTATVSNPRGTFPLCIQYNLDDLDTGITSSTKQLLWDYVSPLFGYPYNNPFGNGVTPKGYYYEYWSQYFNEIYNKEARLLECYLNLTAQDIATFEAQAFRNPVFIKNTLYRVLKVQKYLVGGNQSTKVILLKVLEKNNYDCTGVPASDGFNADGTITFVNPADGTTEVSITNECCEDINSSWTFQQTNNVTGTGICYHNLDIDVVVPDGSGPPIEAEIDNPFMSMLPLPDSANVNTQIQRKQRQIFAQSSDMILSTETVGTTSNILGFENTFKGFKLNPKSMTYLTIDLIGTIVKSNTTSNLGSTGCFSYYTLLKRVNGLTTHEGTAGGTLIRKIEGTNFPTTPTINVTNVSATDNNVQITITSSSANYTISWVGKIKFLAQKLVGLDGDEVYRDLAIYQNNDNIGYQNGDYLEWN